MACVVPFPPRSRSRSLPAASLRAATIADREAALGQLSTPDLLACAMRLQPRMIKIYRRHLIQDLARDSGAAIDREFNVRASGA